MNVHAYSNTCIYIGRDNYFNGRATLIASERKNIIIGDDGLFSFGIYVRTADPHLLYSGETKERINESKSVLMGDHVWIGQGALLLKGSSIGSGSVIGGGAVVSGKAIPSNTVAAGNPAKVIKKKEFSFPKSAFIITEKRNPTSTRGWIRINGYTNRRKLSII